MGQILHVNEKESESFKVVWERHSGLLIAAACLLFIGLAWFMGRNDLSVLEIIFFVFAYGIGGYRKAWEGLQTLIQEKDLDVDLLMVVAAIGAAGI